MRLGAVIAALWTVGCGLSLGAQEARQPASLWRMSPTLTLGSVGQLAGASLSRDVIGQRRFRLALDAMWLKNLSGPPACLLGHVSGAGGCRNSSLTARSLTSLGLRGEAYLSERWATTFHVGAAHGHWDDQLGPQRLVPEWGFGLARTSRHQRRLLELRWQAVETGWEPTGGFQLAWRHRLPRFAGAGAP